MAKRRTAKQRAASIRNLIAARKRRSRSGGGHAARAAATKQDFMVAHDIKRARVVAQQRKGKARVSRSTFAMNAGVRHKVRLNSRPGDASHMRNSPNKRQQKRLGKWVVKSRATGLHTEVGYKTYRRTVLREKAMSKLNPHGVTYQRLSKNQRYTTGVLRGNVLKSHKLASGPQSFVISSKIVIPPG